MRTDLTASPTPTRRLSPTARQRAIGAVVGAAVGDALGAPFEFGPRGRYRERFPAAVLGGTGEMIGGGAFDWAPGEFTDDTQMALVLAETLLRERAYDADVVWEWFRAWAATARDIGSTTRRSLDSLNWHEVVPDEGGAGNGSLMRSFPLALALSSHDDDVVRDVVLHQAALTHQAPEAMWGTLLGVEMLRAALRGDDMFRIVPDVLDEMPAAVRALYVDLLHSDWDPSLDDISNGWVVGCLAQAVWCVRTTVSFEDAVVAAVNLGGDTDTVACVTGALAGALHGVQAIPSRWATYVHGHVDTPVGRIEYRLEDLQRIALALVGVDDRGLTPPEPAAGPVEVAPGVYAADLLGAASAPVDWAVVSLTRTDRHFVHHPVRRQFFIIDDGNEHNPRLGDVITDAVAAIEAFRAEGRPVVVHCHGGRSRTGLVLKAWKMTADGCDARTAHDWLAARWHRYSPYNRDFGAFLEQWPAPV